MRAGFGTNNVDHCTRLCHASSVAALLEGIGSGAVSTTLRRHRDDADVGSSPERTRRRTTRSPRRFFKQARRRGTKLMVVDARRARIADHADTTARSSPARMSRSTTRMMHELIANDWVDHEFIASGSRTTAS